MFKVGDKVSVIIGQEFDGYTEDINLYLNTIYTVQKVEGKSPNQGCFLLEKRNTWSYGSFRFKPYKELNINSKWF